MGAWRGREPASPPWGGRLEEVSIARQPWEGPRALRLPAPHTKAPTETPHLPARAGSGIRAPARGGQAGWREDVNARACVCPCKCASVCVCV